mmetsp:Transcript_39693/g.99965  ORF Transcript_39693/g.99965 Transcript_39693/m.99965 type:complete len:693 (-) Transcript_39693:106-2184(-)|eukprot:CAMPEP_0177650336 /NCGR_PEP_ID=MMETSP0447-20121125/11887_1 /TAXON_ID=0 /ORGANISM="Stygamoeba regulata, Strain BSH-02190019" /LENGTH=692 /DNA_ID=CAMNT_0019153197 /DNA_START=152 /DNA_END=2230 /DNA_ORIENTATION=+
MPAHSDHDDDRDDDDMLDDEEALGLDLDNDPEILELQSKIRPLPPQEKGFAHVVVVDGLPRITLDKLEKLQRLIQKILSQVGPLANDWIYMPVHTDSKDENMTKGYAFCSYQNPESARVAVQKFDGADFDRQHKLRVCLLDDYHRMIEVSEEYVAPDMKEKDEKMNLWSWLVDDRCVLGADQFAVRVADETQVFWHDAKDANKPEPTISRKNWTESYVVWSPLGTYLTTLHQQGVIIWGKAGFERLMQLQHSGVKLVEYSPCEKYLVTFSPQFAENDNPQSPKCVCVWDVKTGKNLRGFPGSTQNPWPFFKWSHDDKYLACCDPSKGIVRIYEVPSMTLLNGKSIKIPGVKDIFWSPSENIITYWTPEYDNTPARVSLVEVPSFKELRSKNLFNVNDCKIHWQNKGDFLCVKVDRKHKKTTYTNFELFRMRERDVPIDVLEMRDTILAFAWEPNGGRFAIIHSDGTGPKPDVSIYQLINNKVELIVKLEKRPANHLFWSPQGTYLIVAGMKNFHGALEFINTSDGETLRQDEHSGCTDVEWDPTGRYVVSFVSAWRNKLETGFWVWTCQGKLLHKIMKDRFYQLLWRPRPPVMLTKEKIAEIKACLSKYSKQYNIQDMQQRDAQKEEERQRRQRLRVEFEKYLAAKAAEVAATRKARRAMRKLQYDSDDDSLFVMEEEYVEELVDTTEEILG